MIKSWKKFNERIFTNAKNLDINFDTLTDIFQDIMDDFPMDIEIYKNKNEVLVVKLDGGWFGSMVNPEVWNEIKRIEREMNDGGYIDQIGSRMEEIGYKIEPNHMFLYHDSFYMTFEKIS